MAAKTNLIITNDIQVTAREIDFVTRFERNWQHLRDILGIMRPIKKQPGAVLKSKYAEGTLQSGNVGEGEEIPYSKFTVKEKTYAEMTIKKYAKAVSIEAIKDHGYENAVQMTDDEFLFQLQTDVTGRFYDYLKTGTLTSTETTFQMALAMAKGRVENKFKQMHRNVTGVVGFVNILDVYEYLGAAEITIQNQFGFQYMKDFMGFNTIFLLSDSEIPRGQVIATPVENIVLYYVDPNESDFARAGLVYTVSGETNLIGFHTQGNYHTAVSEAFAVMGLTLFAEYIDAIAVITIDETPTLGTLTVNSVPGTASGSTKITVNPAKENVNNVYKYKVAAAAATVGYGQNLRSWTTWDGKADIKAANGQKITMVECDGTYKALNAGSASVIAGS
nr:MAG: S-layer protein SbsC C-terminal domain [Bacteriophage sp.]